METMHCIHTRRSIRKYVDIPVEMEKVGRIVEAGFATPTAGNIQDLRYILVMSEPGRKKLAEAALQQYWMEGAPVHIVLCVDMKRGKQFYGVRGERLYSVQHAGAAVMNMMLAAHDMGLGSCWVGAFDEDMVKSIIGIPEYARPHAIITIGYPDETPPKPPKYTLDIYTYMERYNRKIKNINIAIDEWSPAIESAVRGTAAALHKTGNEVIGNMVDWIKGKKK